MKNVGTKHHKEMATASFSSASITRFFQPNKSPISIEAETRWTLFVAEHNLTFLSSEHAAKLFPIMFLDSQISKKYACSCTKCTAFVKEALAPYFTKSLINNPFFLLIDQSNDRKNKACIILVRVLDPDIGYQDKILRYAYR